LQPEESNWQQSTPPEHRIPFNSTVASETGFTPRGHEMHYDAIGIRKLN
jgi:hypothetical protein